MEQIQCCHCGCIFSTSPRHKSQRFCLKPECRRARKAFWKREKMRQDPDYRLTQKMSNKKWAEANTGYWKEYRKKNPEKAERNRMLQTIRNRRRSKSKQAVDTSLIAKVDTSKSNKVKVVGQFWLVPVIAKVDALKVNLYEIAAPYY